MSNAAATKLNTGFFSLPYAMVKEQRSRKPSHVRTFLQGMIYSYTINDQVCRQGYSSISEKLNCARSSISIAVSRLGDNFVRTRRGMEKSVFNYIGNVRLKDGAMRVEYIFCTEKFQIERRYYEKNKFETLPNGKKHRKLLKVEIEERPLKKTEILCLSLFYSYTLDKKQEYCFTGTVREIAGKLNISIRAAEEAIINLMSAELIFRHSKGVNGSVGTGKYVANLGKIRSLIKEEKRKAKKAAKQATFVSKEVIDADARTEYQKREQDKINQRLSKEDELDAKARKDPNFDAVRAALKSLIFKIAKSFIFISLPWLCSSLTYFLHVTLNT